MAGHVCTPIVVPAIAVTAGVALPVVEAGVPLPLPGFVVELLPPLHAASASKSSKQKLVEIYALRPIHENCIAGLLILVMKKHSQQCDDQSALY